MPRRGRQKKLRNMKVQALSTLKIMGGNKWTMKIH